MNRRSLLKSAAGLALTASSPWLLARLAYAADTGIGDEAQSEAGKHLNALFDVFVQERLDRSPERVTSMGLDKGARAYQKSELGESSLAAIREAKARFESQYRRLRAIDRSTLGERDQVNYDVVMFGLRQQVETNAQFDYGPGGVGAPYVLSQLTGAYQDVPDFLDSRHVIATEADANAYLTRLDAFGRLIDEEIQLAEHDAALGVTPPDFVIEKALIQLRDFRKQPAEETVLVSSIAKRTAEAKIDGDWAKTAQGIVDARIYPALDRQIALLESYQSKATHDAGVWRLPKGDAYYAASLKSWTTSDKSPDEIHQIGLDAVGRYGAEIDAIMRSNGLKDGSVGERLHAMFEDPKFRYENTDAAKEKLLADLNDKVQVIRAKLPAVFSTLPKSELAIRRVPQYIEAGAPGGYYNLPSLDGSRPGTYYINLRDTAEWPSWTLPTLTYHEGIPGHHLQLSIQTEAEIPLIRKMTFFSAYSEGWALYSEQLAVEMGMYADDPWGHIGQLQAAMFRGVRLVVDTGMHAKKWSREKAIRYFVETLGEQESTATTEIERYCVWPGQACTYLLGKLEILALRDKAQKALGDRFELKAFHEAILVNGAVPLSVLAEEVNRYIRDAA